MELTASIRAEDGSYWAEVVELPGCFASGETLDELFEALREGIAAYLAERPSEGREIDGELQIKAVVLSDHPQVPA